MLAVHDLQHMEKLTEGIYYAEQVGCLHRMVAVHSWMKSGGSQISDRQLRQDVGHVISDMNTCCVHLLDFLLARWSMASKRTMLEALGERATDELLATELATVMDLLVGERQLPGRKAGEPPPLHAKIAASDVAATRCLFHKAGCERLALVVGEKDSGAEMLKRWPMIVSEKEAAAAAERKATE